MKERIKLQPKPNCKDCLGKGIIRLIPPNLNADIYRELRPCHCVKTIVKVSELEGMEISEHYAI